MQIRDLNYEIGQILRKLQIWVSHAIPHVFKLKNRVVPIHISLEYEVCTYID